MNSIAMKSHTVSLRRAHKILELLNAHLQKTTMTAAQFVGSVSSEKRGERELQAGVSRAQESLAALKQHLSVLDVVGNIRQAIAKANLTHGVTEMLNKQATLDRKIRVLEALVLQLKMYPLGVDEVTQRRNEHIEDMNTHGVAAGANMLRSIGHTEWKANFLSEGELQALTAELEGLEAEKVILSHSIADANSQSITLELPEHLSKILLGA